MSASIRRFYIGIDTSNYTTSCALFDASEARFLTNVKRLLTVEPGGRGLRQSDAVFAHVKNLPSVTAEALAALNSPARAAVDPSALTAVEPTALAAVGVSSRPRDVVDSYMPCFLAGEAAASAITAATAKPLHRFSHQAGHIMAAVWSSGSPNLLDGDFLAFHVSGGTTELLRVKPDRTDGLTLAITKLGGTLDLNAGQAIDRCGVRMGLSFPAGPALEKLALANTDRFERRAIPVKGMECNLSGLENITQTMLTRGVSRECVAAFLLDYIGRALVRLTENALRETGDLPVLYAGGVMSNSLIKAMLAKSGFAVHFAAPEYSSDNAAGTALLCAAAEEGLGFWTT